MRSSPERIEPKVAYAGPEAHGREGMVTFASRRLLQKYRQLTYPHLYNFVFVHINKAAGRSIEQALQIPHNHKSAQEHIRVIGHRKWRQKFTFTFVRNPWDKVVSHYEYRVKTNQTGLGESPVPFCDWVRMAYLEKQPRYYDSPQMFMPQVRWIADEDGIVLVDYVGRFESLADDFQFVCDRIARKAQLPHLNSTVRKHYRHYYDAEAREIIAAEFAADIEAFNYSF